MMLKFLAKLVGGYKLWIWVGAGVIAAGSFLYFAGKGSGVENASEKYQQRLEQLEDQYRGQIRKEIIARDEAWQFHIEAVQKQQEEQRKRDLQRERELTARIEGLRKTNEEIQSAIQESSELGECNLGPEFDELLSRARESAIEYQDTTSP